MLNDSRERAEARTLARLRNSQKRRAALFDVAEFATTRILKNAIQNNAGVDVLRLRDIVLSYLTNVADRQACGEWSQGMKYPAELCAHIEKDEGRIPWMYLDTRGNVTCAIGHLLANPAAVQRLPWLGGDPVRDWETVRRATPGLKAAAYAGLTLSRLSDGAMNAILEADLDLTDLELCGELPGFSQWPESVRFGLIDMGFNLGAHGLLQYHRMLEELRAGNFGPAALESARNGVQPERNEWTRRMIASAGVVSIS